MSDFTLFNEALEKFNKANHSDGEFENVSSEYDAENEIKSCLHENTISEKGIHVCIDCGEEIQHYISSNKEWSYGYGDAKPEDLIQTRRIEERSIFKDVENLGFSENIINKANSIYSQVTQGKIYRGNSRKSIVFACIFHAFKLAKRPQSHEKLMKIFNLNRKTGLKGLKHVNLHAPKDSKIRTTYITPNHLINEIMDQFGATESQKQEVIALYETIKKKSSKLNRSRPQSVSAAMIFYWIGLKGKDISLKDFAKKVSLSELTINKIVKEISEILNN